MPGWRTIAAGIGAPIVLLTLTASKTLTPIAPDPYASAPPGVAAGLLRAAQFGEAGGEQAASDWLATHPGAPATDRFMLWRRLCGSDLLHGRYAAATGSCAAEARLAPAGTADDDVRLANVLRDQPGIAVTGAATVDLIANRLGSRSATVMVNGFSLPWFVDSGAEISVVSRSVAFRLKVQMLPGLVQVGTTTAPVKGELGMIDLATIGSATVRHLPVIVLPDAQLRIADLASIPAILGLPAMVAFGRVAWLDGGKRLALGDAAPRPAADGPRLFWHDQGVGVPISAHTATRGAHFDSGANVSYLRQPGHALLTRAQERGAITRTRRLGGAGGVVSARQKVLRKLPLRLAGAPIVLTDVSIVEQDRDGAARIGDDAIAQLSVLALDFDTMRIAAQPLRP